MSRVLQNFNQTSFSLALIAMVLLTLGTVSISSATDQTATLPPHALGDKWTTIGIIATVSLAVVGISIVSVFFVRQRKLPLPPT
jgi:hypothetical protein